MKTKRVKKNKNNEISKKMTFAQLLAEKPEAAEILMEKGLGCIMCPMAQQETIEQGCKVHGINADDVIKEIKKRFKNK